MKSLTLDFCSFNFIYDVHELYIVRIYLQSRHYTISYKSGDMDEEQALVKPIDKGILITADYAKSLITKYLTAKTPKQ